MDIQHFTDQVPNCPCGAQLSAGHPTMCRKCIARTCWNRRHQPRGGHGGADQGIRTRRARHNRNRDGGEA